MAKTRLENGVEITLCENNRVLGYERDYSKQHSILTDATRVSTYSLTDYKCVHSWSVRQNSPLTSSAVYDQQSGNYVAVKKHKNLIKWSKETTDLVKVKPVLLSTAVYSLLADDTSALVVFEDGAVADLEHVLNHPKADRPSTLPKNVDLKGSASFHHGNQRKICLLAQNQKDKIWRIFVFDKGSENPGKQLVFRNEDNDAFIVTYSLLPVEGSIHVITIWNNGNVCLSVIPFLTTDEYVECRPLLTVKSQSAAVTWLGVDYFAISGVKGIDKENPNLEFLTIWDSKFITLQAKMELPDTDTNTAKIASFEDTILLSRGDKIVAYRFSCPNASLAGALGCLRNKDSENTITVQADWKPMAARAEEKIAVKEKLLKEAMDKQKSKSEAMFASSCKNLLATLNTDRFPDSCYLTPLLQHVARRCTEEKQFWPKQALVNIVEFCNISASSCQEFLNVVLDKQDKDVLSVCLKNMSDVPEDVIVRSLQLFLRSHKGYETGLQNEIANPLNEDLAQLINTILKCQCNDVFLAESLKHLDIGEVLVLVEYLYYLLSTVENKEEVKVECVIDWICLLLDSHYTSLVISNKAKTLLLQLHTVVETQVQYFRQLNSLQGLLHTMLKSNKETYANSRKSNQLYSIETIRLF
ncbi:nucleolar protein 11-like [Antedon mediterranea]|uniref:nucleolar protein 11-like n=1 Tax=Antedon mediterranea TaxID=105859 RepID=UPI003AF49F4D